MTASRVTLADVLKEVQALRQELHDVVTTGELGSTNAGLRPVDGATEGARPLRPFFSVECVAHILAVNEKTVRKWIKSGELAAHQIGGQLRIHPGDLDRFIEQRRLCEQPKELR